MTYFQQLKPVVLKHLEAYEKDFLVYDKKSLSKANKFILCIRKTGTDFLNLEKINIHNIAWCIGKHNERYFYGDNDQIKEISVENALEIARENLEVNMEELTYENYLKECTSLSFEEWKDQGGC